MNLIHLILQLATLIPLTFCENCEPLTVSSCEDAGYKLTARFYDIDGEPYQDALADMLNFYVPLLGSCSKYASTIICSLYLPRCEEGRRDAKPPCRKVCKQFVTDCVSFLRKAGLAGTFTTLCDFLPDEGQNSDRCFYPSNYRNSSSEVTGPTPDVCYDVVDTKCKNDLHYDKTFVPPKLQNTEATLFEAVIRSNCSSKLEKFLCYTQFPPCNSTTPKMAFMPCKALCEEINRDCWKQFKQTGFKLPDCSFIYPQEESVTGLCQIKEWPAPWPKEFRPSPPGYY